MNKMRRLCAWALIMAMVLTTVLTMQEASVDAAKIKLSKKSITLYVGKTKTLKVKGTKKKAKWSSSKKSVATVSRKGKVKAKKAGKAKITARVGKKKLVCKVTVKKKKVVVTTNPTTNPTNGPTSNLASGSTANPTSGPQNLVTEKPLSTQTPVPTETAPVSPTPTAPAPVTPTPTAPVTVTPVPGSTADPDFTPVDLSNAGFSSGTDGFTGRGSATLTSVTGGKVGNCLKVTNRAETWNGASLDITSKVVKDAVYTISGWVKQDTGATQNIKVSSQLENNGTTYPQVAMVPTRSGEWSYFETNYVIPKAFSSITIYFESPDGTFDFMVDEFKMTQVSGGIVPVEPVDPLTLPSLKDTLESTFGKIGSCLKLSQLQNADTMNFVAKQYNSFTLENEMKPDTVLGYSMTALTPEAAKASPYNYVIPSSYTESTVPKLNFDAIDQALTIAKSKGIKMRAHTLLWHQQTREWFFKQGYSNSNEKVSADVMTARLEFYVKTVMKHVMEKEKELMGSAGTLVYAWDVVNEYTHRLNGPTATSWVSVYGDMELQPTYVKNAYQYAYDMLEQYGVNDKVTLFYNDYNTYDSTTSNAIVSLVNFINNDGKNVICEGIGMQSHLDVDYPSVELFASTIDKYNNLGLEIQITELDVTINNNSGSYRDEGQDGSDQAQYMTKLFTMLKRKKESGANITGLTLWGLYDTVSWRDRSTPLLFGTGLDDPKESFYAVLDVFKK